MIGQMIAQIVDSYLTNSTKSREAASQTETNLNTNIGTGKNESQLGGGNTESNIPSDSGLSKTVHEAAGAIGAASKARDNDGGKPKKKETIADKAETPIAGPSTKLINKMGGKATGNVGAGGRPAQWGG